MNDLGEFKQVSSEIVNKVKDQVGQVIESGVQSVTGSQLDPQQVQKKKNEDAKQLAYTRKWLSDLKMAQQKVAAKNKQKEEQRLQAQKQEEQVVEMKKEEKKKQPINPAIAYAGKVEFKRGVGG